MITINDLTIDAFIPDGFKHVCDVCPKTSTVDLWNYTNIDDNIMYDTHAGWVYLILVNKVVYKVGETGMPLGIQGKRKNSRQPVGGTKSRLSRYRLYKDKDYDTDHVIRQKLQENLDNKDVVSFWAKKCDNINVMETVLGESRSIKTETHKILEKMYLRTIKEEYGELPKLHVAIN